MQVCGVVREWMKAQSNGTRQDPEMFVGACTELFGLAMLASWTLTSLFKADIFAQNPLKDRLGYNTLCVGWDVLPAKLVAAPMYVGIIWCQCRYMQLDYWRDSLTEPSVTWRTTLIMGVNFATGLSWILSILIFVVSPMENPWIHSGAFVQLVVFNFLGLTANLLAAQPEHRPAGSRVFTIAMGAVTLLYFVGLATQFVAFDPETKRMGPVPWYVMAVVDYSWFGLLIAQRHFRATGPGLFVRFALVPDENEQIQAITASDEKQAELQETEARLRASLATAAQNLQDFLDTKARAQHYLGQRQGAPRETPDSSSFASSRSYPSDDGSVG